MVLADGGKVFVIGTWGPVRCEEVVNGRRCERETLTVILTAEENASLFQESGKDDITFIFFEKGIGTALCEEHFCGC